MNNQIKKHLILWPVLIFLNVCMLGLFYTINLMMPKTVRYDCSIAEISPDIPIKAKEQCRKLSMKQNFNSISK
jgi:hypothetical protein